MDIGRTMFFVEIISKDVLEDREIHVPHQKSVGLWARLSRQEQKFAKRSIEDMKQHLEQSVLNKLPDRYNSHLKQSVISEEDDMVMEPKLDALSSVEPGSF